MEHIETGNVMRFVSWDRKRGSSEFLGGLLVDAIDAEFFQK